MSAYLVVQIDVKDPERYDQYRKMVPSTLEQYGGKFLIRGGPAETLEGSWHPSRFVVIEFDSAEQAKAWWSSAEYKPAKKLRQQTSNTEMILVEGV